MQQILYYKEVHKYIWIQKYAAGALPWLVLLQRHMSQKNISRARLPNYVSKHIDEDFMVFSGQNYLQVEEQEKTFKKMIPAKSLTFHSIASSLPIKSKKIEPAYNFDAISLVSSQSLEEQKSKFSEHIFDEDSLSNDFTINSNSNNKQNASLQKNNEEEQLSDYGNQQNEQSDKQLSQYENSLFSKLPSKNQTKPKQSMGSQKQNQSQQIDSLSGDIKRSQKTNDILAKKPGTKREQLNKLKNQKKEKLLSSSAETRDQPFWQNKREKIQSKKRFSKRQLELISRRFSQYYAYETNREFKGDKLTLRQIGQEFQVGHATIHKLYTDWMEDPYFYEKIKRYDHYRRQTKHPERKLTIDRLEHVTRLIKENPFLTLHQLCVELNKIEDLKIIKCGQPQNITSQVVSKLLQMGKFRKKRVKCMPKQKNTSKSLQKRHQYCMKYKEILERRAKVYFLDECGFNLYMTRDKAWSRPNEEITVNCPISKGKRFSLIAIIGDDGLAHWRFIEGNYRKFEYLDFIRELFQKIVEHKSPEDPEENWIIMDNCAIHDKQQTINLAKEHGINVLYMPSYSPQLNPIENWFHEIKVKLRKINYSGEKQLFNIMERLLKEYQIHDFSNYYHGSLKFVEKGLKKEKF